MKILIGSYNNHKIGEYRNLFKNELKFQVDLISPKDIFEKKLEIEENGSSFQENAKIKAEAFFKQSFIPSFSDDSGIVIDALEGAPGIFSARYAGSHGDDKANNKKVLTELLDLPYEKRTARFIALISYYDGNKFYFSEGVCEGKIAFEEKGVNGFGYDPIFIPDGYVKSFAQLSDELKNSISHRGKAAKAFIKQLNNLYNTV